MTDPSSKAPAERHSAASAEPALLAELVEQSPDVIVVHDGERILYVNRTGMRLLAAGDGDSLVGRTIQDFLPDSFVAAARARTEEMLHTGQPAPVVEIPLLLGDGTERWGEVRSAPLVGGEHGRVQTVIRDVTERKRMAAALAESEERYRTLFEGVPVGLYRTARDGRFLSVNHALARMLGYSDPESLVGTRAADLYPDGGERESWVADAMEHDVVTGREVRLVGTDGREVRGRLNTRVRRDPEGRVEAFEGSVEDVTETSRAEERYRLLFETMAQGVVYHDARGRIVSTNPAAERILGMGADDLQARTLPEAGLRALRPDGTSLPAADLPPAEALRTGQRVRELVGIELGDGRRQRWLELECLPLIPPGTDRPRGVCSIFVDVTDRLGTEQDLRRSEQRLERALSGSGLGLWDWDMENDEIYLDARWYAMLGYEPGAFRLTGEGWLELVHPEDRERAKEALHRHLDGLEPSYECETRLRTADGGWHWVLDRGRVVERSPDGRPLRAAGTHTDIQERKEAEVALLRSEDRLASIFRAAPLGITLSRVDDGTLLEVNDAFGEEFGYDREELIGRSSVELGLWQDAGERQAAVKELAETGRIRGLSVRFTHRNGQTREVQLFTELVTVEGEACALTLHRDVTEARQLEEQLRQSQKMEAIGRLAGGIAHDFNNLLTVILGNLLALAERVDRADPAIGESLDPAISATRKAAHLTDRLLTFARRQSLSPVPVEVSDLIGGMVKLFRRSLPSDIAIETATRGAPFPALADPHQLESALLNLALNARDAMPRGGRLRIETTFVTLEDADAGELEVAPGDYVRIEQHEIAVKVGAFH